MGQFGLLLGAGSQLVSTIQQADAEGERKKKQAQLEQAQREQEQTTEKQQTDIIQSQLRRQLAPPKPRADVFGGGYYKSMLGQ